MCLLSRFTTTFRVNEEEKVGEEAWEEKEEEKEEKEERDGREEKEQDEETAAAGEEWSAALLQRPCSCIIQGRFENQARAGLRMRTNPSEKKFV